MGVGGQSSCPLRHPMPCLWGVACRNAACYGHMHVHGLLLQEATKDVNKALIMLSCLHCLHNKCWEQRLEASSESDGVTCPVCEQPVPLVAQ